MVLSGAPTRQNLIYYLKYYQLLKRLDILKSGPKSGPQTNNSLIANP